MAIFNLKFKMRALVSLVVAVVLLVFLLFHAQMQNVAHAEGRKDQSLFYSRAGGGQSVAWAAVCENTPVLYSTGDIKTINIWDKINVSTDSHQYKVLFPQGESQKPKIIQSTPDKLTVLIVPHSHNDPGWVETLEEYLNYRTKRILDTMVKKLSKHSDMRMVWAETVFLSMWYEQTTPEFRTSLKEVIASGQFDIVTGGWVMPDEASTHYYAIIDQLIEGHQWLLKTLGVKPRINWSIDPFGHSGTVPYLWRLANFDAIIVQRVHQAVKDYLGHNKNLEFNWRQIWDTRGRHDILCHMMPYLSYDSSRTCGPDGRVCSNFYFTDHLIEHMVEPGRPSHPESLRDLVKPLYEQFRLKAENFHTNLIFVPLGGDFAWQSDEEFDRQYSNYSQVMTYINSQKDWNIEVRFGTLSEYFRLLKQTTPPPKFPTVTGDFYVYSDDPKQYWSGYFTSRPLDKFLGREVQSLLKVADTLHILATLSTQGAGNSYNHRDNNKLLEISRRDLGLYQHHDAITGTAKPHVVKDYEKRLINAFRNLQHVSGLAISILLSDEQGPTDGISLNMQSSPDSFDLFDRKFKHEIKSTSTHVVVFNPSAFRRTEVISVVIDGEAEVRRAGQSTKPVPYQISPVSGPENHIDANSLELSFQVDIEPWSLLSYTLSPVDNGMVSTANLFMSSATKQVQQQYSFNISHLETFREIVLENECLKLSVDSSSGMLTEIFHKTSNATTRVVMEMLSYTPSPWTGAYIFSPVNEEPRKLVGNPAVSVLFVQGKLYSAVKVMHPLFRTTIKLYKSSKKEMSCWSVSIDNMATLKESTGDELVMRFTTDIDNKDVFYTDGNGLDMVKHRRFKKLPFPAAFYPMTSMASIQDEASRLTLHSAQPLGAASTKPGRLEVILDRTFKTDDSKGLGEGIKHNSPVPSKFLLFIEPGVGHSGKDVEYFNPTLDSFRLNDILLNPLFSLSYHHPVSLRPSLYTDMLTMPCDANVVSFRPLPYSEKNDILSTAFILQKRAHACGSLFKNSECSMEWKSMSLYSLFSKTKSSGVREMSLSFTDVKKDLKSDDSISLSPMDIRSYLIDWRI